MNLLKDKRLTALILTLIFVLMLGCNFLTEEVADDFSYHFSWITGFRIQSIPEIIPSMINHARVTNGRVVAHFFVQLFEMLPKPIFNLVNSLLFVVMILLIYGIAWNGHGNNLLLAAIFGGLWVFTPAFGQVFFWLDGSCNYLWGVVAGLVYLIPFLCDFLYDKPLRSPWGKGAVLLYSVLVGAYSENGTPAFVGIAVLLMLGGLILHKKRLPLWGMTSVGIATVFYVLMATAPGTLKNKGGDWSLGYLWNNFLAALEKYRTLEWLLIAFCVLLALAVLGKGSRDRIWLAVFFFLGSLAANFMMAAAAYYPDRSMVFSAVLLIGANAILFAQVWEGDWRPVPASLALVVLLYTVYFMIPGVTDVYRSGRALRANEQYIIACREEGQREIRVPMVRANTKYSANHGLMYLSTESGEVWPNTSMAKYFEVDSIIGYWKQD
ncbi:MAG: hypothetical protein IJ960_08015 [Oscillospiraceae bacterium]|nr:hypothetical protein [Oscillospiraceae bacterium]